MGRTATVVEVASDTSDKTYRVWVDETGPIFCDCPGHKYARHGVRKPCKHMVRLGASRALGPAMALAQSGTRAGNASVSLAASAEGAIRQSPDSRFRFLEVQEEDESGTWVAVSDLRRFNNLEVQ